MGGILHVKCAAVTGSSASPEARKGESKNLLGFAFNPLFVCFPPTHLDLLDRYNIPAGLQ